MPGARQPAEQTQAIRLQGLNGRPNVRCLKSGVVVPRLFARTKGHALPSGACTTDPSHQASRSGGQAKGSCHISAAQARRGIGNLASRSFKYGIDRHRQGGHVHDPWLSRNAATCDAPASPTRPHHYVRMVRLRRRHRVAARRCIKALRQWASEKLLSAGRAGAYSRGQQRVGGRARRVVTFQRDRSGRRGSQTRPEA